MRRRVTLSIVPLLFAAGLIFYKTRTSLALLRTVWSTGVIAARPEVVSLGSAGATFDALHRSINYFLVIWPALAFGILISAAVRREQQSAHRRRPFSARSGYTPF